MIAAKCRNDEMPPGLMAKIEQCFETDFDGDGHDIGDPPRPRARAAAHDAGDWLRAPDRPLSYARAPCSREIWHWWIGVVLLVVGVGAVVGLVAGYLKKVRRSATRASAKREL